MKLTLLEMAFEVAGFFSTYSKYVTQVIKAESLLTYLR